MKLSELITKIKEAEEEAVSVEQTIDSLSGEVNDVSTEANNLVGLLKKIIKGLDEVQK